MKLRDMFVFIDQHRLMLAWQSCIGNANDMLTGEYKKPEQNRKPATADSWDISTDPPRYTVFLPRAIPVSKEQMQFLRVGHIPMEMEDHWFMYCDDDSVNYFRSWNGTWFFSAKYRETESGYEIYELYSASEDKNGSHLMLFLYLVYAECGAYAAADAMFKDYLSRETESAVAAGKYRCFFCEE